MANLLSNSVRDALANLCAHHTAGNILHGIAAWCEAAADALHQDHLARDEACPATEQAWRRKAETVRTAARLLQLVDRTMGAAAH